MRISRNGSGEKCARYLKEEVKLHQKHVSNNLKQFGTKICLLPNNVTVYIQRQHGM